MSFNRLTVYSSSKMTLETYWNYLRSKRIKNFSLGFSLLQSEITCTFISSTLDLKLLMKNLYTSSSSLSFTGLCFVVIK